MHFAARKFNESGSLLAGLASTTTQSIPSSKNNSMDRLPMTKCAMRLGQTYFDKEVGLAFASTIVRVVER